MVVKVTSTTFCTSSRSEPNSVMVPAIPAILRTAKADAIVAPNRLNEPDSPSTLLFMPDTSRRIPEASFLILFSTAVIFPATPAMPCPMPEPSSFIFPFNAAISRLSPFVSIAVLILILPSYCAITSPQKRKRCQQIQSPISAGTTLPSTYARS